jgi:hypothetical protein
MINHNPVTTPFEANLKIKKGVEDGAIFNTRFNQIVGSLRYLYNIRAAICYGVEVVSRFTDDPRKSHLVGANRILRYLQVTLDLVFYFQVT